MAKGIADIVQVDVIEGVPQGNGLNLLEAKALARKDIVVRGTQGYAVLRIPTL